MKILIIGNGYLGNRCAESWENVILSDKRIETVQDVEELINEHNPDVLLNAAGVVGKPNVDWCETHPMETVKGNTVLPITIAEACYNKDIYMLHMATGCVFYGQSYHGGPWTEEDYGNPAVVYTKSKFAADLALSALKNVGIARVRMLLDSKPHPANLLDKLSKYEKIIDVENSITIVDDMIDEESFYRGDYDTYRRSIVNFSGGCDITPEFLKNGKERLKLKLLCARMFANGNVFLRFQPEKLQ